MTVRLPTKDELDYYRSLSLKLYGALEDFGVSTEVRETKKQSATTGEILLTLSLKRFDISVYVFGSQYEGTTVPGILQDFDQVYIGDSFTVVTNPSDFTDGTCWLVVQDKQVGYIKLQKVHGRQPQFGMQNDCLKHSLLFDNLERNNFRNKTGPAFEFKPNCSSVQMPRDYVSALRCKTWPGCAAEWLTRKRYFGWPSPNVIKKCKSLGFLIVPASHPKSEKPDLQWRISFSHQERLLVTQFNSVQLKCYVLLKLAKKLVIEKSVGVETLTSYHCKTSMLYCIENTPANFWVPENLTSCFVMCLRQLVSWVYYDNCPNYFIPGENMFDRIKSKDLKVRLEICLYCILMFGNLEKILRIVQSGKTGKQSQGSMRANQMYKLIKNRICITDGLLTVVAIRIYMFKTLYSPWSEMSVANFRNEILTIEGTEKVGDHSRAETKTAVALILPFLKLGLLSQTVLTHLSQRKKLEEILQTDLWEQSDIITNSSKLKQASILLTMGDVERSLKVLSTVSNIDKISLCFCYGRFDYTEKELFIKAAREKPDSTMNELMSQVFQPCVIFLPNEHPIVPTALKYEMTRYLEQPHLCKENHAFYLWYNWAIVEGKFLTQFLLYLDYKALGLEARGKQTIEEMIRIVEKKIPCHRDTSLNLLGWVHKTRGDTARAVECFQKSLEVQPTTNAACLHLCFLICH